MTAVAITISMEQGPMAGRSDVAGLPSGHGARFFPAANKARSRFRRTRASCGGVGGGRPAGRLGRVVRPTARAPQRPRHSGRHAHQGVMLCNVAHRSVARGSRGPVAATVRGWTCPRTMKAARPASRRIRNSCARRAFPPPSLQSAER